MLMSPCWKNENKALLGKVDFRGQGLAWKVEDVVMPLFFVDYALPSSYDELSFLTLIYEWV